MVGAQLRLRWSPPQISHWLPTAHPDQPSLSAETRCRYLYALPRGARKRELTYQLRQ
ncbi:MAG: hypothetical protein H7330_12645 [Hymenobacteraceae bacterium]|nr:hypothetical protein [Hymenobacteraceae bacterium]